MLVQGEPISRLLIKNSESCSQISLEKTNKSFALYSLLVKDFKVGTRLLAIYNVGVLIVDKIGQKDRQSSTLSL